MECSAHGNVSGTCGNVESKILKICLLCGQFNVITSRTRSLGQGNVFTPVCQSFWEMEWCHFLSLIPCSFLGVSVRSGSMSGGGISDRRGGSFYQVEGLCQESLCQKRPLSGGGLCQDGVSVKRGPLSGGEGFCHKGVLCQEGVYVRRGSLSGGGVFVGRVCQTGLSFCCVMTFQHLNIDMLV